MRNKVLRRIVVIMAIAMFLITAAIVGSFVIVSLNDTETEVKEFADPVVDQISRFDSITKRDKFLADKRGGAINITIFNSNGDAVGDTSVKELKDQTLFFDDQVSSILNDEIGSTRAKYATVYGGSSTMFTYYVKVAVDNKVDPNSFVIVRFSSTAIIGSKPFMVFMIALAVFWVLVGVAIAVIMFVNIRASMEPLTTVQNIMADIKAGTYKRSQASKYLVASEADKMVEEIDNLGAVINDTMHNLNVLLESITQGVVGFDKNGDVIFSNTKAYEFFGIDVISNDPPKEFLKQYAHEYSMFKQSLKSKVPTTFENEVKGRFLHVETIFPPQTEDVDMYMLMVATDITEQVKTAKAKQDFFANASHELKTPLTAISGYSEILAMNKPTEKQIEKCSQEIQANAIKMKALIDEMLQLSKMDSQTAAISKEEISLRNLCEETIDELRIIAKKNNITISIDGDCMMNGNYKEIMMLIKNLVSNAIKYNKENGKVDVLIEDNEDKVVIKVSDNGIGISKENQEKIFERFYRVDESRGNKSSVESSTGLGLSIVKQVVEDHKGDIKVESELGKGTTFIVTMPKR